MTETAKQSNQPISAFKPTHVESNPSKLPRFAGVEPKTITEIIEALESWRDNNIFGFGLNVTVAQAARLNEQISELYSARQQRWEYMYTNGVTAPIDEI
jgi:hypothetical protein